MMEINMNKINWYLGNNILCFLIIGRKKKVFVILNNLWNGLCVKMLFIKIFYINGINVSMIS